MSFKIYTKTGDGGETGLYGGKRVPKDHIRIDAYGTVDELNSHVGLLIAQIDASGSSVLAKAEHDLALLKAAQSTLFTIGSQLATPPEKELTIKPVAEANVKVLEDAIDRLDVDLPGLTSFVLPGGSVVVGQCHVCRTVTRRAERCVVALHHEAPVDAILIHYLNRLSDYFFALSRALGNWDGIADIAWHPEV
ncbi:MAG: cob(I)yrinic acid a,c-diamide adenosyltransferase [Saprospiraceae bacterium]